MRVLMTGGYGCIGSWVAKQLVDAGQEVWIYDLKEDTHRLDLILRAGAEVVGPFRGRATSPTSTPSDRPSNGSRRRTSSTWRACKPRPAGPIRSWARRSTCSGRWRSSRRRWPSRTRCSRVVYASSAAVHGPPDRRIGRPGRRRGPPGAADSLRCVQGLQRAQRPGLLARSRDHQHRPAALDGLRRRSRFRHDQRADQGDQGGGPGPAVPDQLRRQAGPAIRRRRGRDLRARTHPAVRRGRRVQPSRRGRADRGVRGSALRRRARCPLARHPRRPATADRPRPRRQPAAEPARADPDARRSATGIAETYPPVRRAPRQGRLDDSDL